MSRPIRHADVQKLKRAKLLSHEFACISIHENVSVLAEINRNRGYGLDPLEILIGFEEAAEQIYDENPHWVVSKATFIRDERNRRVNSL